MLNDEDEIFEAMPEEMVKGSDEESDTLDDLDDLFLDREGEYRDENDDGLNFNHE